MSALNKKPSRLQAMRQQFAQQRQSSDVQTQRPSTTTIGISQVIGPRTMASTTSILTPDGTRTTRRQIATKLTKQNVYSGASHKLPSRIPSSQLQQRPKSAGSTLRQDSVGNMARKDSSGSCVMRRDLPGATRLHRHVSPLGDVTTTEVTEKQLDSAGKHVKIRVKKSVTLPPSGQEVPKANTMQATPSMDYFVLPQRLNTGFNPQDAIYSSPPHLRKRIDSSLNVGIRQWSNTAGNHPSNVATFRRVNPDVRSGAFRNDQQRISDAASAARPQPVPSYRDTPENFSFGPQDHFRNMDTQRALVSLDREAGVDTDFDEMRLKEQDYDLWYSMYQYDVDPVGAQMAAERAAQRRYQYVQRLYEQDIYASEVEPLPEYTQMPVSRSSQTLSSRKRRLPQPAQRGVKYTSPMVTSTPARSPIGGQKQFSKLVGTMEEASFESDPPSFAPDVSPTVISYESPRQVPLSDIHSIIEPLSPHKGGSRTNFGGISVVRTNSWIKDTPDGEQVLIQASTHVEKPPSPEAVRQMVEEELEDFERSLRMAPAPIINPSPSAYGLRKRINEMRAQTLSMAIIEESLPLPSADGEVDDMQPEVAAAIMHTEEQGLQLDTNPANMYSYLFSTTTTRKEPAIEIGSVAPPPLQGVVIPLTVPRSIHESVLSDEFQRATAIAYSTPRRPRSNIYSNTVNQSQIDQIANFSKEPAAAPLSISKLVGAENMTASMEPVLDTTTLQTEEGLEILLHAEPPRRQSKVQLRGSQNPSWFPGYYVVLPDTPEIRIARSPSAVLNEAWRATHPTGFSDNSRFLVS